MTFYVLIRNSLLFESGEMRLPREFALSVIRGFMERINRPCELKGSQRADVTED